MIIEIDFNWIQSCMFFTGLSFAVVSTLDVLKVTNILKFVTKSSPVSFLLLSIFLILQPLSAQVESQLVSYFSIPLILLPYFFFICSIVLQKRDRKLLAKSL